MNCQQWREQVMDVIYGEEVEPKDSFRFFDHLQNCQSCDQEYVELLETRSLLSRWEVEERPSEERWAPPATRPLASYLTAAIPSLGRVAAMVLMSIGLIATLQTSGVIGGDRVSVTRQQLLEMVNDMVVARQQELAQDLSHAMVDYADTLDSELKARHTALSDQVAQHLYQIEQRYLESEEQQRLLVKAGFGE